jgi:RND family efflux transporter MFP subunit
MKTAMKAGLGLVIVLAALLGGYWLGKSGAAKTGGEDATSQPSDDNAPVVPVQTVPIVLQSLRQTLVAYGPVAAEPSSVSIVSAPFDARIGHMAVTQGQRVAPGDELGEIGPSPDALLQIRQSQSVLEAAEKDLAQAQRRFKDGLATNSDLLTSQQNLAQAKLKLDFYTSNGAGSSQTLKASAAGIVSKVDVQNGQIVSAGNAIVEIAAGNAIIARLGVEPGDVSRIKIGDAVSLTSVAVTHSAGDADVVQGTIKAISQSVNPDTRLVDVLVSLPAGSGFMLGSYVRGEVNAANVDGLVVPRSAVLPSDDGWVLFTVKDQKAVKHAVASTMEAGDLVSVTGKDLSAGDLAVVVGNYELDDGTLVSASPAPSNPAVDSTQPTTAATIQATTSAAEAKQ